MSDRQWFILSAMVLLLVGFVIERGCARDLEGDKARIAACQAAGGYIEKGYGGIDRCYVFGRPSELKK